MTTKQCTKCDKAKEFVKNHKKEIAVAGGILAIAAAAYTLGKNNTKRK